MKITIDTQVDSYEDMKKAVELLKSVLLKEVTHNVQEQIFEEKKPDTAPDFGSFLGLMGNNEVKEKKDDKPKLQFY